MPHAQLIQQQAEARDSSRASVHRSGSARLGAPVGRMPEIVERAVATPGEALDGAVRTSIERSLGHDFNGVRVHRDHLAAAAAATIGARAYTVGRDVVFGAGQYAPSTLAGRALLAHELAHATQQPATRHAGDDLRLGARDDAWERNADDWSRASLVAAPVGGSAATVVPTGGSSSSANR